MNYIFVETYIKVLLISQTLSQHYILYKTCQLSKLNCSLNWKLFKAHKFVILLL